MLFEFLESIADLVTAVIGMVINFFQMVVMMLTAIPKAITYIITAVGYMPPFVGSVILISIGIAVTITVVNHWSA